MMPSIDFTAKVSVITNNRGLLTKRIKLEGDALKKDPAAALYDGAVHREHVATAAELATLVESLRPNQALIHGDFDGASPKNVVSRSKLNGQGNTIARTREFFHHRMDGGTLCLDYDYRPRFGDPLSADEWLAALESICPGIASCASVLRPSTSAQIYNGESLVGDSAGLRLIPIVDNAADIQRFGTALYERLWLAGLGFIDISADGKMLERTIIDAQTFDPERIDFVAGAKCEPPLVQRLLSTVTDGPPLDTTACRTLGSEEHAQYKTLVQQARNRAAAAAAEVREAYVAKWTEKHVLDGMSRTEAERLIKSRIDSHDLLGSDKLVLDSGQRITVARLLLNPEKYTGQYLRDPIEPEYGSGKARFNGQTIYSWAHGGREFRLFFDWPTLEVDQQNWRDRYRVAKLSPSERELFVDKVKDLTRISKPAIRDELKDIDAERDGGGFMSHHDLAKTYLVSIKTSTSPVSTNGSLWLSGADHIWRMKPDEEMRASIGEIWVPNLCERGNDYKSIAYHVHDMTSVPEFFDNAPKGVACPSGFYRLDDAGEIHVEPLTCDHRARFVLPVDPIETPPTQFLKFLSDCFRKPDGHEVDGVGFDEKGQITVIQEIFGAVLLGTMAKYEIAVLFKGLANSGKSTLMRMLESLVPAEFVSSTPPDKWGREYYAADLAGKMLNIVGELDDEPISAAFKTVTGRDRLTGRHPTHRPFTFRNTAAHIFNSNEFPPTRDRSSAFWRRWLVVGFFNSRVANDASNIRDLDEQIMDAELGSILAWAMEGAKRVEAQNGFSRTTVHEAQLALWKHDADTVLSFLSDPEWVVDYESREGTAKRSDTYRLYKIRCFRDGLRPLSKRRFFSHLTQLGVREKRVEGEWVFEGFSLVKTRVTEIIGGNY